MNRTGAKENDKWMLNLQQHVCLLQEALGIPVKITIEKDFYIIRLHKTNSFDGKPETECFYGFTPETRNTFTRDLKDYNKEDVESFINRIESDVGSLLNTKSRNSDLYLQRFQIKDLQDMIKTLECADRWLSKICSGRFKALSQPKHNYNYVFKDPDNPLSEDIDFYVNTDISIESKKVLPHLKSLLRHLKEAESMQRKKRGKRSSADKDNLTFQIAKYFQEFIDRPRPFTGPFPKIVRKCFKIFGSKKDNDQTRAIRYALKKLSSF